MKRLGKDIYALRLMKKDEKGCLMFITIVCLGFTVGKLWKIVSEEESFIYSRWDLQHYRAKKQRAELEEKYKQREEARLKGRKVVEPEQKSCDETLLPDCLHSKFITKLPY